MAREKRELGLLALESAIRRAARAQSGSDEISYFASVAEAIWWLTTLDEALWETNNGVDSYYESASASNIADLLLGLRYVRNRQVHDVRVTGMHGNPLLEGGEADDAKWRWRSLDDEEVPDFAPRGRRGREGESVYQEVMADHEILPTLEEAAGFLDTWIGTLDPEPLLRRETR